MLYKSGNIGRRWSLMPQMGVISILREALFRTCCIHMTLFSRLIMLFKDKRLGCLHE